MSAKVYTIKTACPQCGCSAVSHLTADEIREKFGDVPNVEMECSECMAKYTTDMKTACPEWDKECKMRQ
jgi:redox-regulated HSP33 family molecular chaperone